MTMAGIGHNRPPGLIPSGRYIAVHTEAWRDHPLVGKGLQVRPRGGWGERKRTYNRGEAFEDLMFMARWKAGSVTINGQEEWLDVGQLFGSVSFLEERWNWSAKTVRTWLKNLEDEGLIVRATERAKGRGNGEGKGFAASLGPQNGNGKGEGFSTSSKFAPTVITICNYREIQDIKGLISAYCDIAKWQREGQGQGQRPETQQGQREGQREGNSKGREIQTDIQTDNNPSGARAHEKRDPFGLNQYEATAAITLGDGGEIVLTAAKRAEWLGLFNHDAIELELALKQVAAEVQVNSTTPLQTQVERSLSKEARYRRERESRSEKRATSREASPFAKPKVMSMDERLRLERERKAQEAER